MSSAGVIYRATGRSGVEHEHRSSPELTTKQALERLGIWGGAWTVTREEEGFPETRKVVQTAQS